MTHPDLRENFVKTLVVVYGLNLGIVITTIGSFQHLVPNTWCCKATSIAIVHSFSKCCFASRRKIFMKSGLYLVSSYVLRLQSPVIIEIFQVQAFMWHCVFLVLREFPLNCLILVGCVSGPFYWLECSLVGCGLLKEWCWKILEKWIFHVSYLLSVFDLETILWLSYLGYLKNHLFCKYMGLKDNWW